jgi:hypothetical protein
LRASRRGDKFGLPVGLTPARELWRRRVERGLPKRSRLAAGQWANSELDAIPTRSVSEEMALISASLTRRVSASCLLTTHSYSAAWRPGRRGVNAKHHD